VHAFDAKAVDVLRLKEVLLSTEEENALYIAILHDIGHGPFTCHGKKHC
jgi:HD superfamily phosphohydrolase